MSIAIRFVGGPADGRTLAIPDSGPPFRYLIPLPTSIADLMAPLEPVRSLAAEYEPLIENGLLRIADDGAYLYQHRPPPVTPEQRRALEAARREKRAAEEKRDAERNAAWREIRGERPHYPADWRDLFG